MRVLSIPTTPSSPQDGYCYLRLFQPQIRAKYAAELGAFPTGLALRYACERDSYGHLNPGHFHVVFGSVDAPSNIAKFLAHIECALPGTSLLRARDVLDILPLHSAVGADDAVLSLVTASQPTNTPRAFHCVARTMTARDMNAVHARVFHGPQQVNELITTYSRAHWTDLSVVFVPTPLLSGHVLSITACVASSDNPCTTIDQIMTHGTCVHYLGGGADRAPPIFTFPVQFADAHLSPLIKPHPIELPRGSICFVAQIAKVNEDLDAPDGPLLHVALKGHMQLGGQA